VRQINEVLPNPLAPPSIEVVRYDFDRDTVTDQFNLTMKVKVPETNMVLQQANLIAAFDYETTGSLHFHIEALAHS
jgi:hypothetical protein